MTPPIPKPPKREPKPWTRLRRKRKGTPAALAREADRLWSLIVRYSASHGCEAGCGSSEGTIIGPHVGALQAAHGFSRRYRNTRWLPVNGFALCAAHHVYWTHRPIEWDEWLRVAWGQETYYELRLLALRTTPPDVSAALEKLRAEAKERGIE